MPKSEFSLNRVAGRRTVSNSFYSILNVSVFRANEIAPISLKVFKISEQKLLFLLVYRLPGEKEDKGNITLKRRKPSQ